MKSMHASPLSPLHLKNPLSMLRTPPLSEECLRTAQRSHLYLPCTCRDKDSSSQADHLSKIQDRRIARTTKWMLWSANCFRIHWEIHTSTRSLLWAGSPSIVLIGIASRRLLCLCQRSLQNSWTFRIRCRSSPLEHPCTLRILIGHIQDQGPNLKLTLSTI